MMPEVKWVLRATFKGGYYPEDNIIILSPHQSQLSWFITMLHEMGHWLLFRMGQSDAVHTLNCAFDYIDSLITQVE